MAEKRGQYVYNDDGTISQLVSISGADSNGSGLGVTTNDILPVDIQARYAKTEQTHNAVSVATLATSAGSWIDCDGFDKLCITFLNDVSGKTASVQVRWSNDGVNLHGVTRGILEGITTKEDSVETGVKARYASISLYNGDTVSHTMSAWAYLKV